MSPTSNSFTLVTEEENGCQREEWSAHIFETNHHLLSLSPSLVALRLPMEWNVALLTPHSVASAALPRSLAQRGSKSEQQATNERGRNQMSYDPGAIMDTLRTDAPGLVTLGFMLGMNELNRTGVGVEKYVSGIHRI